MERFTGAIRKSLDTENWYAALYQSLVVPDICGKLSYPEINSARKRCKKWFNVYLANTYKTEIMGEEVVFLTASDFWALRCSLIHEGIDDISEQKAQEILNSFCFTTLGVHCNSLNDILILNVSNFCNEICEAVEGWAKDVKGDSGIADRMKKIIRIKEEGFSPMPGVQCG